MANQNFSIPQEGYDLDYNGVNINIAIGKALDNTYSKEESNALIDTAKAEVDSRLNTLENKVNENFAKSHIHGNKNALDGIDDNKITNWDKVSEKEDKANKTTTISATAGNEKYPTAQAVYDFVMHRITSIYDYKGFIKLANLENPDIAGSGAYYNILEEDSRDFVYRTTIDTISLSVGENNHTLLTFPYTLPENTKSVVLMNATEMKTYTLSNLTHIDGATYEDSDDILYLFDTNSAEMYVNEITYTVSAEANQGVLSTGRFWEELPGVLDLSVFDTSEEVDEKISESVSSAKSEVLTYVDEKTGEIVGLGTLTATPTEYTVGDVGRIYAYVDYTENENGIAKQLYTCTQKYEISGQRTTYQWLAIPFTDELATQIGYVIHNELPDKQDKDFIVNGEVFTSGADKVVVSNADATFLQIRTAYEEGRRVLFHSTGLNTYFPIASVDNTKATFIGTYDLYSLNFYCDVNNTWDGIYYWLMDKDKLDLFLSVYETNITNLNVNESLKVPNWSAVTNLDGKTLYNFVNESVNDKLTSVYKFKGNLGQNYVSPNIGDVYNIANEQTLNSNLESLVSTFYIYKYSDSDYRFTLPFSMLPDPKEWGVFDFDIEGYDGKHTAKDITVFSVDETSTTYQFSKLLYIDGQEDNNLTITETAPHTATLTQWIHSCDVSIGDNVAWTGYYWDKLGSTIINMDNVVGQATDNGGEIFNDYENNRALSKGSHTEGLNNTAGAKAYRIIDKNDVNRKYILDDVTGLAVGDIYSVRIDNHYLNIGTITEVNNSEKSVVVDTIVTEALIENVEENSTQNIFYVSEKPDVGTIDIGIAAHAEGNGTRATGEAQHVEGKWNTPDGTKAHILGNGTDDENRSNAHTIDWDGNAWYAGSVETQAIILVSPNGNRFKLTVSDNGELSTIPA